MTTMMVGIAPETAIRSRILAIAKGDYLPAKNDPKVWFTSLNAVAQVLSPENISLLRVIDEQHPQTIRELSTITRRKESNLSRTLKVMAGYGFVDLIRRDGNRVQPVAKATEFTIQLRPI